MKVYATFTSYEPPYSSKKWGSQCIEVATYGTVPCDTTCLSEKGVKKIKAGGIVRFFSHDIDYKTLRVLFGEI